MANEKERKAQEAKEAERQEKVAEQVSKTDQFLKEHSKLIYGCLIALLLIGLGIVAWQKFILQPKKAEGMAQMYPAEASYRAQEYELALNGDGNVLGFKQIIDEYGTKAGGIVYFYAGMCNLELGNYEEAISMFKKYKGKESILSARSYGCIGDAYVGLEKYAESLPWFEKAAARANNPFAATYLLKAGVVCEEMGDNAKALAFYKQIKDKYPQSMEGYDIDKYISRIETVMSNK